MKNITVRHIFTALSLTLVIVACGCSRAGKGAAGDSAVKEQTAPAYDASRVHALLDQYSAGTITDEGFGELMDAVEAYYDHNFATGMRQLEQAKSREEFDSLARETHRQEEPAYPYATMLPQMLGEAALSDPRMSDASKERWRKIDERFAKKYEEFNARYRSKFGKE